MLGSFTLSGEIVDSKCWTGVMNPGVGHPVRLNGQVVREGTLLFLRTDPDAIQVLDR